jgi:hypothetical protein
MLALQCRHAVTPYIPARQLTLLLLRVEMVLLNMSLLSSLLVVVARIGEASFSCTDRRDNIRKATPCDYA